MAHNSSTRSTGPRSTGPRARARHYAYGAVPLAVLAATATGMSAQAAGSSATAGPAASADTRTSTLSACTRHPTLEILQSWFPRSDVNGNDRVSRREFTADAATSFRVWDVAPRDGVLRGDEVTRAASEAGELLRQEGARPNYLCIDTDPPAGTAPGGGGAPDLIAAVDSDGDGAVTSAEWDAATRTRFQAIDCNGDRTVVAREALLFGRQEPCPTGRT